MALYRLKGAQGNSNSYVYTNPASSAAISHRDRVFVLGHDISDELLGEQYEVMERHGKLPLRLTAAQLEPEKTKEVQVVDLHEARECNVIMGIKVAKDMPQEVSDVALKLEKSVDLLKGIVEDLSRKVNK